MATMLGLDALVVIADTAVARNGCTIADVEGSWPGQETSRERRLREAAALVHPGSRSPKETELRPVLVRAGLPCPSPTVTSSINTVAG
jgi:hypothetical protein